MLSLLEKALHPPPLPARANQPLTPPPLCAPHSLSYRRPPNKIKAMIGFRGTHAAVLWASFLAAQRLCQRAYAAGLAPEAPPGSD